MHPQSKLSRVMALGILFLIKFKSCGIFCEGTGLFKVWVTVSGYSKSGCKNNNGIDKKIAIHDLNAVVIHLLPFRLNDLLLLLLFISAGI